MARKSTSAFVLGLLLGLTRADQPVHCLRENIIGDWKFHVTKDAKMVNLFETKDICTH